MEIIGGRAVHPQAPNVNSFGRLPRPEDLVYLQKRLKDCIPGLIATVQLFKSFELPDFSRETEYLALKNPTEYALIRGDIASTDTGLAPVEKYQDIINEFTVPQSTAKFARHTRESFAVGALARVNINYDQLRPMAKKAAGELNLKPPCYNPFMNNLAQIVEIVHEIEESLEIIEQLLDAGIHTRKH